MIRLRVEGKEFFLPEGRWSLAELLSSVGYDVPIPCAGLGNCGKCQIRVKGNVEILDSDERLIPEEKLRQGYVLACRPRTLAGDLEVESPRVEYKRVATLDESVRVEKVDIGIDLGTTSVIMNFMPHREGRVFYVSSFLNPQTNYGADVISRSTYIDHDDERLELLRRSVMDVFWSEIRRVKTAIAFKSVEYLAIAGNSVMEHIIAGYNPLPLTKYPFEMSFKNGLFVEGDRFGLPEAGKVYLFPLIGPYVGGDTVALLVDVGVLNRKRKRVIVDIGTNGEIVVQNGESLQATAAAAGPAFEGGNITFGMRAEPGAIERVWLEDDRLKFKTVGNRPPVGICGSGLLDLIALLRREEVIDADGTLRDPFEVDSPLFNRIKEDGKERIFLIYMDAKRKIYLTQNDIREFQLAKGAIRAGIEVLLNRVEMGWDDIEEILIAGAFGSYLTAESLVGVNMLPPEVIEKINFIGDGVIRGINRILRTGDFKLADEVAERVGYVELSMVDSFQEHFLKALAM